MCPIFLSRHVCVPSQFKKHIACVCVCAALCNELITQRQLIIKSFNILNNSDKPVQMLCGQPVFNQLRCAVTGFLFGCINQITNPLRCNNQVKQHLGSNSAIIHMFHVPCSSPKQLLSLDSVDNRGNAVHIVPVCWAQGPQVWLKCKQEAIQEVYQYWWYLST